MVGIEKSLEVFEDLEKLGVELVKIAKNGLGLGSMFRVLEILKNAAELVKDAQGAIPELADLDPKESGQLAERAFVLVKNIIVAVKA